MSTSLNSNVIQTFSFFIQFLSRITILEIGPTYMIICYWPSGILSWSFIHFLRMTLSSVVVLVSISYFVRMVFSLFLWIYVLNTIVILVPESINLSLVVILSFFSCIVIGKVIKFPNPDSSSFSGLSRFSMYRRL